MLGRSMSKWEAKGSSMSEETIQTHLRAWITEAASVLSSFIGNVEPCACLILGSGLNPYGDTLVDKRYLPFGEVPHLRVSSATGHKGCYVLGRVEGTDTWVLVMQGRIHAYEGASAQDCAFPVWVASACGIKVLITTNAAGAINPSFPVGSFCSMSDHINLTGHNPIVGMEPHRMAERFVPMADAYDAELRCHLRDAAAATDVVVNEGVYLGLLGPSFETPAEIRAFAQWNVDTVAMSLVEEVIAARHQGMRVVGISLISNMACGVEGGEPTNEDIMDVAEVAETSFKRLMDAFLPRVR
jgi:purine-nucleoside phosphorylase